MTHPTFVSSVARSTSIGRDPDVGLAAARRGLVAGVRVTARLVELLEGAPQGLAGAALLPALSLARDLRLLGRLRDPSWWPGAGQWVLDAAEIAARSLVTSEPGAALSCVVANVIPTGVMATFQATAGRDAVPVVGGAAIWPPASRMASLAAAARASAPLMLGSLGHVVGERVRGRRPRVSTIAQVGIVSTGFAVLVARHRDRVQSRARTGFRSQITRETDRERRLARLNQRTAPTPGHDFAKTLAVLGELGDDPCRVAALEARDRPRRLVDDQTDGGPLRSIIGDLRVEPPDAGRLWIPATQMRLLQEEMARAEASAVDGADQTVRVRGVSARRVDLDWLGSHLTVELDPPRVAECFYPTSAAFVAGANYKLLPMLSGSPAPATVAGATLDALAAWRHRRPDADGRGSWSPIVWSTASTIVQTVLVRPGDRWERTGVGPPVPATANCTGAALVWASHWGRLERTQRWCAAVPALCWLTTMRRSRPHSWRRWGIECCYLAMPILSAWRLTDRLDQEADVLAATLHEELGRQADSARIRAEAEVDEEYRRSLALARAALGRLAAEIPEPIRLHLAADCDELERWLRPRARVRADSLAARLPTR